MRFGRLVLFIVLCSLSSIGFAQNHIPKPKVTATNPLQWDWDTIDLNQVSFPPSFGWGAATSAYQIEGDQGPQNTTVKNSWSQSDRAPRAGNACDHWARYKEDVQLIKQAGLTQYRFSVKWSAIEPEQGKFDEAAMQHYVDLVDELRANNIEPFITFFHHTWPSWFDKKGNFEKKENIRYFVAFANYVFGKLHGKVKKWIPLNEPAGYCLQAFFRGEYPPYKKNLKLAGKALKNMLDAHVAIYHTFKKADPDCQVGIAKMFVPLDPYKSGNIAKRVFNRLACKMFGPLQNNVVLDYFRTGTFDWGFRVYGKVKGKSNYAKGAVDFIGVNYYSNVMIDGTSQKSLPGRDTSDSIKAIYPEGLWRCLVLCAKKLPGVPIIITENGISDAKDTKREDYFKKHLWVVSYALQCGCDIRGYHVWTLLDSYNWNDAFSKKYGLYTVDYDTQERTLRDGAKPLINLIKTGSY